MTKGIEITEQLLKDLGAEPNHDATYFEMRIHGWSFYFKRRGNYWVFKSSLNGYEHSVTHLDECFGFILAEGVRIGKEESQMEIRQALGIKE